MPLVSEDLFIIPDVNLTEESRELSTVINLPEATLKSRWKSQRGIFIINRWKAQAFGRAIIDEMVGKCHGHTDLRGIPLRGEIFRKVDLSNVDFFCSDFEGAEFEDVDLHNSWLSHCNLRSTVFKWSKMQDVLMDDVNFDNKTSFLGVDLKSLNFTKAALLHENALVEQRIQHLNKRNPILSFMLKYTCDYGRSFPRFLLSCVILIMLFGVCFYIFPHALNTKNFWDCLSFSFLAFIKASPKDMFADSTHGKLLFMCEGVIGYVMLAVLVSIIVRKTFGR